MLPCSVCESRGNLHLVLFESDEQGGDQFASQEMTYHAARQIPGSSKVVDLKNLLFVQINCCNRTNFRTFGGKYEI